MSVKRGDTLIEVSFAIAIFALVCVFSIGLMNSGVDTAQASMELTMARNEIDSQSEALRFIQNSYLSEKELVKKEYSGLWNKIKSLAIAPDEIDNLTSTPENCWELYENDNVFTRHAFVLNTRKIDSGYDRDADTWDSAAINRTILTYNSDMFHATSLYPRLLFRSSGSSSSTAENSDEVVETAYYDVVQYAEGLGVIAVKGDTSANPEFYDFHIRTCWYAPGRDVPTTINTIIRLYNPEYAS